MLTIQPTGQACGAIVTGVDLSKSVSDEVVREIREAWMAHLVLAFPDQQLTDDDLVRITEYFGGVGDDPYFESISSDTPVVALTRRADEKAPVFAETWHSDWSFKPDPPIGTCLYSLTIPPIGGDTSFINLQKALADMPAELRSRLEGKRGVHTAAGAYAPEGAYGEREKDSDRSMKIVYSEDARDRYSHPLIIRHPESGKESLFGCFGYIVAIEGLAEEEGRQLLAELYQWETQEAFQYTHKWQENMLVLWDNRSVLHKASGGYDGYDRELHRTTIAAVPARFLKTG
jgi:taurine dioxygenase